MNRSRRPSHPALAAGFALALIAAAGTFPAAANEGGPANFDEAKRLAASKKSLMVVDFGSPT
jgi:hypothetical protein